jgi:hypothetical protein
VEIPRAQPKLGGRQPQVSVGQFHLTRALSDA